MLSFTYSEIISVLDLEISCLAINESYFFSILYRFNKSRHISSKIYDEQKLTKKKQKEFVDHVISLSRNKIISYDRQMYFTNFTE